MSRTATSIPITFLAGRATPLSTRAARNRAYAFAITYRAATARSDPHRAVFPQPANRSKSRFNLQREHSLMSGILSAIHEANPKYAATEGDAHVIRNATGRAIVYLYRPCSKDFVFWNRTCIRMSTRRIIYFSRRQSRSKNLTSSKARELIANNR